MTRRIGAAVGLLSLWASVASAQTVSLTLKDGRVTLNAENASVRQILAEWERQGQVRITGVDKLTAGVPLTLTLTDVPERQALDIVLRALPGYMVVDRAAPVATLSRYDRLLLLPRASTPVSAVASGARPAPNPAPAQAFVPPPVIDQDVQMIAAPDRDDVEQFTDAEPPMPGAPVLNPYPGGAGGGAVNGPYGGNAAAAAASGAVNANPPETQFDYANPQKYFERMRQLQQQQQPPVGPAVTGGLPPGTTAAPGPSAVPTAPGSTLAQPGIAPAPQQAPPGGQQQFFNPYNLPPDYVPPPATTPTGTPIEPDRSKYANPYVPQPKPPVD
jgi:hypothetical protein